MSNPKYGPGYEKSKDKTRAKKRVLHLLERSQKSEKQLRDKLKEGGYEQDVIDEAIDYAKSYHYIDDERFARDFVRLSCHNKSRIRLKQDLSQKGIDKDLIDIAIEEEYEDEDIEDVEYDGMQEDIEDNASDIIANEVEESNRKARLRQRRKEG